MSVANFIPGRPNGSLSFTRPLIEIVQNDNIATFQIKKLIFS